MLKRSRKMWLGTKPVFEPYRAVSAADLTLVEQTVRADLPEDMRAWLLLVGYGDINEDLSFRLEWFKSVEQGALKGAVLFAQDNLGNFYAYVPSDGSIVFFSRSAPQYAVLASSFRVFMEELEQRDYKLMQWVESLVGIPYQWDA
jgi:hypothetical protein